MNSVNLIGNLTREIELRYTPDGSAVCDLGLAINERVKRGDQWVDSPVFVDCTCWGRTAEIASEYCEKGSKVGIVGRLQLDQWDDKQTGQKRSKIKVVVSRLELLGDRGGRQESTPAPQPAGVSHDPFPDDDIPF